MTYSLQIISTWKCVFFHLLLGIFWAFAVFLAVLTGSYESFFSYLLTLFCHSIHIFYAREFILTLASHYFIPSAVLVKCMFLWFQLFMSLFCYVHLKLLFACLLLSPVNLIWLLDFPLTWMAIAEFHCFFSPTVRPQPQQQIAAQTSPHPPTSPYKKPPPPGGVRAPDVTLKAGNEDHGSSDLTVRVNQFSCHDNPL